MRLIGSDRPRGHHYAFAHQALRALATGHAQQLDDEVTAASSSGAGLRLGRRRGGPAAGRTTPHDGLAARRHRIADRSVIIVTLPPAEHITEAHLVGVVGPARVMERYIVLEHSWTLDDAPST